MAGHAVAGAHDVFATAGFGWQLQLPEFDWSVLKANRAREILRLNGVYEQLLLGAGVQLVRGWASLADAHTVHVQTVGGRETFTAQHILLSVADQGRGLPPGDPDALFTAFTRGERESAISGVGLGLAICRTIADVHGGRISAANLPAGGACFTLSLPLAPQPALDFDPENL